jgi:glycosyltransferase involved in cell wall biosynthesis
VALVSQEFPPHTGFGGIGTQTAIKARGLAGRGHDVLVISHSHDLDRHEERVDGATTVRIPGGDARMPVNTEAARWVTYSAAVAAELHARQRQEPIDLIDFPDWGGEGFVYLLNRAEWEYVPVVLHLHGPVVMLSKAIGWPVPDSDLLRVGSFMEATCVRLADQVISSGTASADAVAEEYGYPRERMPIVHTGVDVERFAPDPSGAPEAPTVAFAGKVAPNKGINVLLDACLMLRPRFPDLRLRVAGRGEPHHVRQLEERARATGAPDLLDLCGYVPHEELPAFLTAAHVFAAPSVYEGGPGFVYLEAMACGLPAIATRGSGAEDAVRDGETGYLVDANDAPALAHSLGVLLADRVAREAMGRRGREFVVANASSAACLDALERVYAGVVARVTSRPAPAP